MFFIYDKNSKQVKMYSDSHNTFSNDFGEVEINPTVEELQKIKDNWKIFYRGKLEFEENDFIKAENKKKNVEQLKKEIGTATTVTKLKDILNTLLDNL